MRAEMTRILIAALLFAAPLATVPTMASDTSSILPPGCSELFSGEEFEKLGGTWEGESPKRQPARYPLDMVRLGKSGSAKLLATIDPDGTVVDVQIVEATTPSFGAAGVRATKQWRYARPRMAGRPVCVIVVATHDFMLR